MKNVEERYLLVIIFCTKNVLYNFYVKHIVVENEQVTKNEEAAL